MQEKVIIQIYNKNGEYIAEQDVSGFTMDQAAENMRIKEKEGYSCFVKRVFIKEEV